MVTPVLFVHNRSTYKKLPLFDCYDEKRNALNYTGSSAVICHPPCRTFSRLRGLSSAPIQEKQLAYFAIDLVRKNGGIVEHPADSNLWKECNIVKPGTYDIYGGFTFCIDQSWFGYYTQKRTLLYIVGMKMKQIPDYDFNRDISTRKFQNLTAKQRSETTVELCLFLQKITNIIEKNKIA